MIAEETRQQRRFKQRQEKKGVSAPQKGAFKRALEAFKMRAEAMQAAMKLAPIAAKLALMDLSRKLGEYKSRGHGRGTPARNFNAAAGRSRYQPHQGAQERLRRSLGGWGFQRRIGQPGKREALYEGVNVS